MKVPLPKKVPAPYRPDDGTAEPITGSSAIPATQKDVKTVLKIVKSKDVQWFVASMAGVAVATAGVIAYAQTAIKEAVDGGGRPLQVQITENRRVADQAIGDLKVEVKEAVRSSARAETMTEMLLRERGLTPPPRVASDGGEAPNSTRTRTR